MTCKKLDKKTTTQEMGPLPEERLKPAPAWNCTAVDLFGSFKIRDEVKKRTVGKAYGVISLAQELSMWTWHRRTDRGGAGGAAPPQLLGDSNFLGSKINLGKAL